MARGGKREGKPGTAYANRSDLNTPKPPTMQLRGQEYGTQAAQVAQQQATPEPRQWTPPPEPVGLFGPSTRPDEPVTHGLPSGPGAGPEVLGLSDDEDVLVALRAAYDAFPSSDLLRLIFDEEGRRGGL